MVGFSNDAKAILIQVEEQKGIRINKYLSEIGYCSRRAGDQLILENRVTINGLVPEMGTKVMPTDEVAVDGVKVVPPKEEHVYIAFNKPVGIVCTTDVANEKDNVIDYIKHPKRIFHIGRLDKPSEGLLLLTSDGDIVNKILRAGNNHEKEYIVVVNRPITADFIKKMGAGVPILDTVTKPCFVEQINKTTFKIVLTQGLNRQIRRMCEHLHHGVVALKRVRIMHIHLDVPKGKWRDLTAQELTKLNMLIAHSSKTTTLNENE